MKAMFEHLKQSDYLVPEESVRHVLTPALVFHGAAIRNNLRRVIACAGDDPNRWRPHMKTSKSPHVFREMLALGIRHFKCATLREAEVFLGAAEEADLPIDLMVAYTLYGPALDRLCKLAARFPRHTLSTLTEEEDHARAIDGSIGLYVDVNSGMNRTGIPMDRTDEIVRVTRAIESFRGVHFYDGHMLGVSDTNERSRAAARGYETACAIVRAIEAAGIPVPELLTSGTPVLEDGIRFAPFAALESTVHRISAGTAQLHDARSQELMPDFGFLPGATVLVRVISFPRPGWITVDCGSKGIAAEAGAPVAFVLGHPDYFVEHVTEEHIGIRIPAGAEPPARGSLL
ncbi:MAG: D-TA family PLP-dependent enzyme, partial [Gemmatimonadetes bacterium]|nr:D-TA family PLP-dependent enzyme [Gemmatimonadota bacterium]